MSEYKNVGTVGHIDQSKYTIVVAPGHEEYVKELLHKAGYDIAIHPTGQLAFFDNLKAPVLPPPKNNEKWRGKGKRRMPKKCR